MEADSAPATLQADQPDHELRAFLDQDLAEISSEYSRIRKHASEDPGTAGDEGEENWASLLRHWLPPTYQVVTKGRMLSAAGVRSPQLDVLVLSPSYPKRLLDKKVYLASGVLAAFECKTTLKAKHVAEAAATSADLSELVTRASGTPHRELFQLPVFGVLAHSHDWKSPASTPAANLDAALEAGHCAAAHPRQLMDLVCVADLNCWVMHKTTYVGPAVVAEWPKLRGIWGLPDDGGTMTAYTRWSDSGFGPQPNPIAVFVAALVQRLAWNDAGLRPLADYFRLANIEGASQGDMRAWPAADVFSAELARELQAGRMVSGDAWSEWAVQLP